MGEDESIETWFSFLKENERIEISKLGFVNMGKYIVMF